MSDIAAATEAPLAAVDVRSRIDAMSPQQIEIRRNEILLEAKGGDYESLSTESLHELAYIASRLRRTNVGPPKEPKAASKPKLKSMEDFI